MRKRRRRLEQGTGLYRRAPSTLRTRMRKKILANWYKTSNKEVEKYIQEGGGGSGMKRKTEETTRGKMQKWKKEGEAKAVKFCPYTKLARFSARLRIQDEAEFGN